MRRSVTVSKTAPQGLLALLVCAVAFLVAPMAVNGQIFAETRRVRQYCEEIQTAMNAYDSAGTLELTGFSCGSGRSTIENFSCTKFTDESIRVCRRRHVGNYFITYNAPIFGGSVTTYPFHLCQEFCYARSGVYLSAADAAAQVNGGGDGGATQGSGGSDGGADDAAAQVASNTGADEAAALASRRLLRDSAGDEGDDKHDPDGATTHRAGYNLASARAT